MSPEIDRSGTPILSARGLHKRYGNVTAIDGADFDLYNGEILAVIGDNGAGKSSMIKALSGATIPDEGEIRLDGEVVNFKSPARRTRGGHRDRLPGPRGGPRARHRDQPVPRSREAARRLRSGASSGWSTTRARRKRPSGR